MFEIKMVMVILATVLGLNGHTPLINDYREETYYSNESFEQAVLEYMEDTGVNYEDAMIMIVGTPEDYQDGCWDYYMIFSDTDSCVYHVYEDGLAGHDVRTDIN